MKKSLLLSIGLLLALVAYAQKAKPKAEAASTVTSKSDLYKGLKWRNMQSLVLQLIRWSTM
jgi:hypothetical protein